MYSNRSNYSHKRQYNERNSSQWDEYDDRREERREPHKEAPRESYHKYGGDGRGSSEGTSRSREYSDSPQRLYSKESLSRDWSRKSPVRRHMSPLWDPPEQKRRRFTEDDDNDYRHRSEPQEKASMQSPDSFSRSHVTKDFKDTPPQEEDFKYRKTPQDSRHRLWHEEFTYMQQHNDVTYRRLSGSYKDRDGHERSRDGSRDRTRSQDHPMKNYAKPRETTDSPSTSMYPEDYQNRARFLLNGSSGQSFETDASTQSAAAAPEQKSTKGFQRFLDVLNKGVNVDVLTKIVTQTSAGFEDRPLCPSPSTRGTDRPWSPSSAGIQQGSRQNNCYWGESERSHRHVSPEPRHRSRSPKRGLLSDEKSLQKSDGWRSYSSSRSKSPPVVEKMTLTPEDEYKHRQMQHILQAIGMNLGFEELGQMSNRIQERLYGKKDSDCGRKVSREGDAKQSISPQHRNRSSSSSRSSFSSVSRDYNMKKDSYSAERAVTEVHEARVHQSVKYSEKTSSRSSFSPLTRDYYTKTNSHNAQRDVGEVHEVQVRQAVGYGQKTSCSSVQDIEKCEGNSQEASAALQSFLSNSTYTTSKPPAPVMPTYSPINCSPLPYPALPPALPPILPHLAPGIFLPHLPPLLPNPRIPPLNILPAMLAQTRHLLPPHIRHPQPPFFNLPHVNSIQPLNATQKPKTQSRPRCLQVIETKLPG